MVILSKLQSLSLGEKEDFPEQHLSLLSGYKGSPTLAYLEKGPLDKGCRFRNWCQWGSPCLLSLAGVCAPAVRGTEHSALPSKVPCPSCATLSCQQAWTQGSALRAAVAACPSACLSAWLLVCLATAAGRVSYFSVWGLLQPRSGVPSAQDGLPPMPYFVVCLFAHLLRLVAAAKIKKKTKNNK